MAGELRVKEQQGFFLCSWEHSSSSQKDSLPPFKFYMLAWSPLFWPPSLWNCLGARTRENGKNRRKMRLPSFTVICRGPFPQSSFCAQRVFWVSDCFDSEPRDKVGKQNSLPIQWAFFVYFPSQPASIYFSVLR